MWGVGINWSRIAGKAASKTVHVPKSKPSGKGSSGQFKSVLLVLLWAAVVIVGIVFLRDGMAKHPSQGYLPPGCHWVKYERGEVEMPDCPSYHTPLPNVTPVTLPANIPLEPMPSVPVPPGFFKNANQTTTTVPKSTTTTTVPKPFGCHALPKGATVCGAGNG